MKPTIGRAAEAYGSCTKYCARLPMTTRLTAMGTLAGYVMRILTPSAGMPSSAALFEYPVSTQRGSDGRKAQC